MSEDHNDDDDGNDESKTGKHYKVGHGKPPKEHQFKKGQSGNPRGRKPRVKNASTLIQIELDKLIVVRDGDQERKISKREAFITSLVNDAITNKPRARSDLLKLLDVSPPPEPFVPNEDDEAALDEFLERMRKGRRGNGGGDDGGGEPPDGEPA